VIEMRLRRRHRTATALLLVAALAAGLGVLAYATHLLRRSEQQTIDARFAIRGRQKPPRDIVLVQIDNETLQQMARAKLQSEFPFPRRYHATVVDRLRRAGARAIVLDMEFTHETDPRDDYALAEALARAHGKTVLAATEVQAGGRTDVLGGPGVLREIGARAAEDRLVLDSDGATRRFAHSYNGLGSIPVVTAEVARRKPLDRSLFGDGTLPIDFVGPAESLRSIPYSKVLKGEFPRDAVRGKVVFVGASAPILGDVHSTATTSSEKMAGDEIQASATSTLLRGVPLRDAAGWLNVLLVVLLGVAAPLVSLRLRRLSSLLGSVLLALAFAGATQLAFDGGLILSFVYPVLALALGTLGTLLVLYVGEAIERERTRYAFSRFVPAGVVDEVLAGVDENLRLGGVERDCTVLFSDLRGFTSFSETQPAARVIDVVNCYLNEMTEAILEAGGTLISYMGDGIMAIFGAPLEQDDHADRAVAAAREMVGPRLERFNAWLAEEGFDHSFAMGVGLNSGTVMAGNVGSEERIEYTAIGDTTNTASRLEGMTKNHEAMVFVAASTRERMRAGAEQLTLVGEFEVRGRMGMLAVFTFSSLGDGASAGVAAAGREGSAAGSEQDPAAG
jgi:adenylate cyclase